MITPEHSASFSFGWSLLNILQAFLFKFQNNSFSAVVLKFNFFSVIIFSKNLYTHSFKISPYIMSIFHIYPLSMEMSFFINYIQRKFYLPSSNKFLFLFCLFLQL